MILSATITLFSDIGRGFMLANVTRSLGLKRALGEGVLVAKIIRFFFIY